MDELWKVMQDKLVEAVVSAVKSELNGVESNEKDEYKRYMNKKEASEYVNVSLPTLEKMINSGLKIVITEGVYRIDKKDIDAYMEANKK